MVISAVSVACANTSFSMSARTSAGMSMRLVVFCFEPDVHRLADSIIPCIAEFAIVKAILVVVVD